MHNTFLDQEIMVLGAARTAVGKFEGILAPYRATDLGTAAIKAALEQAGVSPEWVELGSMGIVASGGLGMAPAKTALMGAGVPATVPNRTTETVCGSGMDAIAVTCDALALRVVGLAVAGGMESRTNAPYQLGPRFIRGGGDYARGARLRMKRAGAYRFALDGDEPAQLAGTEIIDATSYDGLFWPGEKKFMREYAVAFAKAQEYTVGQINALAAESHAKAAKATEQGLFGPELVALPGAEADQLMSPQAQQAELERNPEDIASAYNASSPADGGAALVLASGQAAAQYGLAPIARILGYCRVDGPAADFLSAPVRAVAELLGALEGGQPPAGKYTIIEANEAFGVQIPLFLEHFAGMALNVHGGAIALGHPLGAAGARITTTLIHAMRRYGHGYGIATLCYGGGGAYALAVEAR